VAVVELPYHPRLVVLLLKRPERVLDAIVLFIGRSPAVGLLAQDFHHRGHKPTVDCRLNDAVIIAMILAQLE